MQICWYDQMALCYVYSMFSDLNPISSISWVSKIDYLVIDDIESGLHIWINNLHKKSISSVSAYCLIL